ncbi:MAG: GNAT family N-acetyltransferase [Flavobacteriales bacterium]|nr:GNAT family N-acetyltransferase [Flavobacteriales bacterium]
MVMAWENNPEFREITEHNGELSQEMVLNFIRNSDSLEDDQQLRLIIHNESGDAIGALDLFDADLDHRSCGIGILIANPADRGKGYGHDALSSLIRTMQSDRRLIHLRCLIHETNEASKFLFLKNGFVAQGTKIFKGKKATQYLLDI